MKQERREIKIVEELKSKDKFFCKVIRGIFRLKGLKFPKSEPKMDESGQNNLVFRKQTHCYEENGEIIYRCLECKDLLYDSFEGIETIIDLFERSVSKNENKEFLGVRPILSEEVYQESFSKTVSRYRFGPYKWTTYSSAKRMIDNLAIIFLSHGFCADQKMALFLDTSPTFLLSLMALFKIKSPAVTVYSTLSDDNIVYALNLTKAVGVVVDKKSCPRLLNLLDKLPYLKTIILAPGTVVISFKNSLASQENMKFIYFDDLNLEKSLSDDQKQDLDSLRPVSQDLAIIMFTSGSSGSPKGVMLIHQNIVAAVAVTKDEGAFYSRQTYIGYLPLAHIYEAIAEFVHLSHGARIGYGHPLSLFDSSPMIIPGSKGDMTELQPTFFCTVPLLLERLKKMCIDKVKTSPRKTQLVFEVAINLKMSRKRVGLSSPFLDKLVFNKVRTVLGGKVTHGFIGGATLDPQTEDFITAAFCENLKQGYGLTENCCAGTVSNLDYWRTGNTGTVAKCSELKLISWEEGGYFITDPKPRGQILISGKSVSVGYYEMPELTSESFVKDEKTGKIWFKTGDIGEYQPDGTFRIIDRIKDIIKLKHGEYISLVHVEEAISRCILVDIVCVLPNLKMDYLVALVVLNRHTLKNFCLRRDKKFTDMDMQKLIEDKEVKELAINEIIKTYKENKLLNKYETPRQIYIIEEIWTPESGLLTPSAKLRRPQISSKYKSYLE